VGQVVTTLADDGLRVRSQPRVSDDSEKYDPLLPLGTRLYVLDGPVSASGYVWYEVVPLARGLPWSGWVASAGRDGEPWIAVDAFDCPPLPTDFQSLAALPRGVGLACFPRVPITVKARLMNCNCDPGPWGGGIEPVWMWPEGGGTLLVDPSRTRLPDWQDWFELLLDPAAEQPKVLPVARYQGGTSWSQVPVVEVTGMFDHPAAAACTYSTMDSEPVPTQECRLEFAVTRVVVLGP
jgi:hypothetical protein